MIPMLRIIHAQHIRTLLDMVDASKQGIHVLQCDLACLRYEQPDKHSEAEVDAGEEEECVEAAFGEEAGEELQEDCVDDVLGLRCHADGLRPDVEGEDF